MPCTPGCICADCLRDPMPDPPFIGVEESLRRSAAAEERRRTYTKAAGVKTGHWRG